MQPRRAALQMIDEANLLRLSRETLDESGLVVADVLARVVKPDAGQLSGINIAFDTGDKSPACDVNTDPFCDGGRYDNYTVEVVDRMGTDSFTPDSGVLIAKTKNSDNSAPFEWVIDANHEGNSARWINFSCDPNCEAVLDENEDDPRKSRVYIEAKRAIKPGEELTYDYGIVLDEPHTARLKKIWACRCGSKKCRGTMLSPKR